MKSLSSILRIVAIIAAIVSAALFFISQGKLKEKQAQLESAQSTTQAVRTELETANTQITSLESNLGSEREAHAEVKRNLEAMRSEMYTAKQEVTSTQQQLREAKNQIETLTDTAKRLRTELVASEQELAAASKEGEIAQLNERIAELEKANKQLESDLKAEKKAHAVNAGGMQSGSPLNNAAASMTASSYQMNSGTTAAVAPASIGQSTTIEALDSSNGIIILKASPELALAPGQEIKLVKDLKAVGNIQITSVSNGFAVANILSGTKTRALTVGTSVDLLR
ncbi:MAG: hypothetical protein ACSHX8_02995 [Opitutaceae bacterium]